MGKYGLLVRTSVVTLFVTALSVAAILLLLTPHKIASDYNHKVSTQAHILRQDFIRLEETLDMDVFNTPDARPDKNIADIEEIEEKIDSVASRIEDFHRQTSTYSKARYTTVSFVYATADTTTQDVEFMVAQSGQVLSAYAELVSFLKIANQTMAELEVQLDYVNSIRDFNSILGSHADIVDRAKAVEEANKKFDSTSAPAEYSEAKAALLQRSQELSQMLRRLAAGLRAADDSRIYDAVREIERITDDYHQTDRMSLFEAGHESPTLLGIGELSDKLIILEGYVY